MCSQEFRCREKTLYSIHLRICDGQFKVQNSDNKSKEYINETVINMGVGEG